MNDQLRAWKLLKAALFQLPTEERPHALSDLGSGSSGSWHRVVTLANAHFVTPALWPALQGTAAMTHSPRAVREYLEAIYGANRARNAALLSQLDELIHALNGRRIVPTLLKGACYLKSRLYDDVGVRFLADLDVLVHPEQLEETRHILESLDYVPARTATVDYATHHHHVRPLYREGDPGVVEIHREAVSASASSILPASAVLARGEEHAEDGIRYRIPSPSHLLMVSFLHAEVSDRHLRSFVLGLRPMQDLSALHDRYGRRIHWSMIEAEFSRSGLGGLFRKYLLAAWRITGVRLPPRTRFRIGDHVHYGLSELRMRRPGFGRWLARLARLSAREVQRRYGEADGWLSLARYRVRRGCEMVENWLRERPEGGRV